MAGLLDASIEGRTCEEIADAVLATAGSSDDLTDDVVLVVMRTASAVPGPTLAVELPRSEGRR